MTLGWVLNTNLNYYFKIVNNKYIKNKNYDLQKNH